jgi:mRNA interferase RelE/StbE
MKPFDVILTREAQADIRGLPPDLQNRILDKLAWMGINALLLRRLPLQGKKWEGTLKYRVGDYRIIYQFDQENRRLVVLKVGHRRDVYKR